MGLDISAYKGLEKIDCVFDEEGDPIDATTREPIDYDVRPWVNPDFPGRADDIESRAVYKSADSMSLTGWGYGRYNAWREQLAKLAGYPATEFKSYGTTQMRYDAGAWAATAGPFWELIYFTDCDGTVGSAISAKLAKDFADHAAAAEAIGGHFFEVYQEFRDAFEMAADNGCVRFH